MENINVQKSTLIEPSSLFGQLWNVQEQKTKFQTEIQKFGIFIENVGV